MASGPVSKAIYWRRRFVVLAGLLAVLTLIAYACRPSDDEDNAVISASTDSSPGAEDASHSAESAEPVSQPHPPQILTTRTIPLNRTTREKGVSPLRGEAATVPALTLSRAVLGEAATPSPLPPPAALRT